MEEGDDGANAGGRHGGIAADGWRPFLVVEPREPGSLAATGHRAAAARSWRILTAPRRSRDRGRERDRDYGLDID